MGNEMKEIKNEMKEIKNEMKEIKNEIIQINSRLSRLEGAFQERGTWLVKICHGESYSVNRKKVKEK